MFGGVGGPKKQVPRFFFSFEKIKGRLKLKLPKKTKIKMKQK